MGSELTTHGHRVRVLLCSSPLPDDIPNEWTYAPHDTGHRPPHCRLDEVPHDPAGRAVGGAVRRSLGDRGGAGASNRRASTGRTAGSASGQGLVR